MRTSFAAGLAAVCAAAALSLSSCQTPPKQPEPAAPPEEKVPEGPTEPITIGVVAPLSGAYARAGVSEKNGILLAVRLANERGGLFNARVSTVIDDGACNELQGKAKAKWLISVEEIRFLIGEICPVSTIPATDLADDEGAVMISPVATDARVTLRAGGALKPFIFRTCMMDALQGRIAARFARETLGKAAAAVIYNKDSAYSRDMAEAFAVRFTSLGGTITATQFYTSDPTDYTDSLKVIGASKAEVLFIPDDARAAGRIITRARSLTIDAVFMGGDRWESDGAHVEDLEGGYFTSQFSPLDTRPAVQEWVSEYSRTYGAQPDAVACLSFDAALIMMSAIQSAGTSDPVRVRDALARGTWPAVTGPISFDAEHNPVKPGPVLQLKAGRTVFAAAVAP